MTDEATIDDADEQHAGPTERSGTSRRSVLAVLSALGGLATHTGSAIGGARAAVTRSRGSWRVEVDGETGLELDPAERIEIDDEA
jgi:hypothetical protein